MSTHSFNTVSFRWRSWLGVSVALFLFYALLNAFAAVFVPLSLHLNGAGAVGDTLVLSAAADAALLGRSLAELNKADPNLGAYLVTFMDTMCAQMMAFAILQLGMTWFALRRGQAWALFTILIADVASYLYFIPIIQTFARYGVVPGNLLPFVVPVMLILASTIMGWFGLRPGPRGAPA